MLGRLRGCICELGGRWWQFSYVWASAAYQGHLEPRLLNGLIAGESGLVLGSSLCIWWVVRCC